MTESNGTVSKDKKENAKNYKGFVAGVFSGVTKLSGMLWLSFFPHCEALHLETVHSLLLLAWETLYTVY